MILIAVALFAALSYAITQTTRNGGGDTEREKISVDATWLENYGSSLSNGLLRMRMSKSVDLNSICFFAPANPLYSNTSYQASNIFHTQGGGVVFENLPASLANPGVPHQIEFTKVEMPGVGSTTGTANSAEVVLFVAGIKKTVCDAVNRRVGIATLYQYTPTTAILPESETYPGACVSGMTAGTALSVGSYPALEGHAEGCLEDSGSPGDLFYYYRILVER